MASRKPPPGDQPPPIPFSHRPYVEDHEKPLEDLQRELDHVVLEMHCPDEPGPSKESLRRLEQIVHELGRRGPELALDAGFGAVGSLLTLLLYRLRPCRAGLAQDQ